MESGELVRDEMAVRLLEQRLGQPDTTRRFVLDGFPLTVSQAESLERLGRQRRLGEPLAVHLSVSGAIAKQRMLKRRRAGDQPAATDRHLAEYRAGAGLAGVGARTVIRGLRAVLPCRIMFPKETKI